MTARSGASASSVDRRYAADPAEMARARVDRVQAALVTPGADVVEDRPPGPARRTAAPITATDCGSSRWRRLLMSAEPSRLSDRRQVRVQRGVCVVARQRDRHLHHTIFVSAPNREPGVGEHPQHRRVVRQCLGDERRDAVVAGAGDQVLQQAASRCPGAACGPPPRRPPRPVPRPRARSSRSRRSRRRDSASSATSRPGRGTQPAGLLFRGQPARAEEPEVGSCPPTSPRASP
jgi:hypothetical protein